MKASHQHFYAHANQEFLDKKKKQNSNLPINEYEN